MTDVLAPGRKLSVEARAEHPSEELWMSAADLEELTGWKLSPEGLCKGDGGVCVPLDDEARTALVQGDAVHASALWRKLSRPVLHDAAHTTWFLGESASDRARDLSTLQAPDFTLPDIEGKLHSLSDYRGHKVLLATWASW